MASLLSVQRSQGVARVFFDRSAKANALNSALLDEAKRAFTALEAESELRAVVLGGNGKTFCGGADTGEMSRLDASSGSAFVARIHDVCAAIRALPVPVLAQMQGAVIGAGLEIAAACDLRVAAKGTRFSMPEVKLGIPSVVEAALLPRLIGAGRARWLVMTGEAIEAQKALQWGLIDAIGSPEDILQSLLSADREALRVQKRLCQLWEEAPLAVSVAQSIERFGEVIDRAMARRPLSAAKPSAPSRPPSSRRGRSRKG